MTSWYHLHLLPLPLPNPTRNTYIPKPFSLVYSLSFESLSFQNRKLLWQRSFDLSSWVPSSSVYSWLLHAGQSLPISLPFVVVFVVPWRNPLLPLTNKYTYSTTCRSKCFLSYIWEADFKCSIQIVWEMFLSILKSIFSSTRIVSSQPRLLLALPNITLS